MGENILILPVNRVFSWSPTRSALMRIKSNGDLTSSYFSATHNKMKLLVFGLGLIQSASAAADFDCVLDCYRDVFRGAIKCDLMEDATEDEKAKCHEDVFREFWLVTNPSISSEMNNFCN